MNSSQLDRLLLELKSLAYPVELAAGEILFTQTEPAKAVFMV
jgi:hypothetical protein